MELIIVRHALPEKVVNDDPARPADPPLDQTGFRQADLLAEYLATEKIHALYCSPLQRARQTAAAITAVSGLEAKVHDGVAEWDRSSPVYIPIEELKATNHPDWLAMQRGEWTGEGNPIDFQRTVVAAIEEIALAHPGQRVVIACHGGVINSYLAHVMEIPRPTGFFHPDYTSISRVLAASTGERSIRTINETPHLRGTGLLTDR
jgi:broad specificity phosphatase PhoE